MLKILDDWKRKPNKTWVDEGSESCNRSMKLRLEKHDIEKYSTHNEGKYVVFEEYIKTLKSEIYKKMIAVSKNVYIDNLSDIVNKYNNTYHKTTKMKPVDVKNNTHIDFGKEVNDRKLFII